MNATNATGTARLIGKVDRAMFLDGETEMNFSGEANIYILEPPLRGYSTVVASTIFDAVHLGLDGPQWGVETFLFGVHGDGSVLDSHELPGSGWGNTVDDAFTEAGYVRDR